MPLTEQTVKKIWFIVFISLAVIGALFTFFVLFLNRGTLTVVSSSPYNLTVPRIKTEICTEDTCSVVLAPGDYDITVSKAGYRDITRKVSVPIGGEAKEEIQFAFVPVLGLKGDETDLKLFSKAIATGEDLPKEGVYMEKNHLAYIERDSQTHRQTLYVRPLLDGKAGEKTAVTSFIRDIDSYVMVPSIEERNKIALIDSTAGTSTLYMIDLTEKSRESLLDFPLISDIKWLPGGDDFLFEAREGTNIATNIFVYRAGAQAETAIIAPLKLNLATSLKNVVPVSKDRLVAATVQYIAEPDKILELEGGAVTLGEAEATPQTAIITGAFGASSQPLSFVDYSLVERKATLLKTAPDLAYPAEGLLSETKKSAYFLIEGKVYELKFSD